MRWRYLTFMGLCFVFLQYVSCDLGYVRGQKECNLDQTGVHRVSVEVK